MKSRIISYCIIIASLFFLCNMGLAKLTNQQMNLLLENDDVQIFTTSPVIIKKVSISIEQSSDNSRGKTIVEYDKRGLLVNYYSALVIGQTSRQANRTMITTLIRTKDKWQRKQTMGLDELDNRLYAFDGDKLQIVLLSAWYFDKKIKIGQTSKQLAQGLSIIFSYAEPIEKESLKIEYIFNPYGRLDRFDSIRIDNHEHGYTTMIKSDFKYDEQQRLVGGNEILFYQLMDEPADQIIREISYNHYDEYGNWLTKIEKFGTEQIIYKRIIEYWE